MASICNNKCLECKYPECLKDVRARQKKHEYYIRNKERIIANDKRRKEANPEAYYAYHRAYSKRYAMTHDRTEYFREYYKRQKELKNDRGTEAVIYSVV